MPGNPRATYRIQLHPGFDLVQSAAIADYLAELGVSHLYTSPLLQATAGSTHGYDVVDPSRVAEDLGGASGHARLVAAVQRCGLDLVVDLVPNHMAIMGGHNPWWWDVLENGPASRYATYFDVDWEAAESRWPNQLLLPILGDHYGRVLEAGELRLAVRQGAFTVHYYEHVLPLDPSTLEPLLAAAAAACNNHLLGFLARSCARLPRPTTTGHAQVEQRHRDKGVVLELLTRLDADEPAVRAALDAQVARVNADPDLLDSLLADQNYRLAFWRTAGRDLGYRRFFDIHQLAALRIESEEVFDAVHTLPLSWVRDGAVGGLRVDHPDGLRNPTEYFQRLRRRCPDAWIVAEKILEAEEELPATWPIAGTTGYDFLVAAGGLFVDPAGEAPLTRLYASFSAQEADYEAVVLACKRQILRELLGSEVNRLAALFVDICEHHRRHRDYTHFELQEALREVAACFPVYRTYLQPGVEVADPAAQHYVEQAVERAAAERPDLDPELFRFLRDLLLLQVPGAREAELAVRFQQLTGPAMAKGAEDTAFYRYHRLVCLNEVGGNPGRFGTSVEAFQRRCATSQTRHPGTLLATSTHDTKRSEDVRMRLALLSEIPAQWHQAVERWAARNRPHRSGESPDPNLEYLLYQTLVGAWPIDRERIIRYLEKAAREAKVHTSWRRVDADYEAGLHRFVEGVFSDPAFLADLEEFVAPLVAPGRVNSLALTLLKMTAPGAPDFYQGSELWDLSLVDPDNRRPVDFDLRVRLLEEVRDATPEAVLAGADRGLPKLWLIHRTLTARRDRPEPFGAGGDHRPLSATGAAADHVVAFARGNAAVTVVPRLVLGLAGQWADTRLELPPGHWENVLTREIWPGGSTAVGDLLRRFPVALLMRKEEA